jgi:hypothetical protein
MLSVPCGAFLGITVSDPGAIAALIALATLVLRAAGLVLSGQQSRQRDLFSKAYGSAMGWSELLYRVRRRTNTPEADAALVDRFHDLQEQIDYFEGWTASEGEAIGRSYCQFVREVKGATESLIQDAWQKPGRLPGDPCPKDEVHPHLHPARMRFLADVRAQLSFLLLPRLFVIYRNQKP